MTDPQLDESPAETYHRGLLEGRLRYQRCDRCANAVFFPRVVCPSCGASELTWSESAGVGTVYSTTITRSRAGDYNVALIDLDEGFRMMCTVVDGEDAVLIGNRVVATVPPGTTPDTLAFRRMDRQ